jgi:hypothetical protein
MIRFAGHFCGLVALALALPVLADDKPASPTTPPANKDAKKYTLVSNMVGKLDKVNAASSEAVLEYRAGIGKYAKNEKMDLTFADEMKVWFVAPPMKIDENGDSRKMTPAELDKIKSRSGPTKGWYAGEVAGLHSGQQVQLVLGRLKDGPKKPPAKEKGAAAEKEFLYVTQIVVTGDDKPPTKPNKDK